MVIWLIVFVERCFDVVGLKRIMFFCMFFDVVVSYLVYDYKVLIIFGVFIKGNIVIVYLSSIGEIFIRCELSYFVFCE